MSGTLMISVSGMRGHVGTDLTPELVARHAAALGAWARAQGRPLVVLGRDARTSGAMFAHAAAAGIMSVGVSVSWKAGRQCKNLTCGLPPAFISSLLT